MESQTPSVVLAAYAEPLLDGRRVLVVGDATSRVADELIVRGARSVLVLDPTPSRAALGAAQNRTKQVTVLPLDDADIAVKDGVFDVALVADLSALASPEKMLGQLRKALSPRGTAIVAAPNPEVRLGLLPRPETDGPPSTLGYYELYDLVAAEFAEVRMLGQTPFVGYAVVDFAPEGEPSVALDSGLLPGGAEEPEWFVAVAGREPAELDELSIVQLPLSRVLGERAAHETPREARASRATDTDLQERVRELETALARNESAGDQARSEIAHLTENLRTQTERAERAMSEAQAIRQKSAESDERIRAISAEVTTLRERATAETERSETTRNETATLLDRVKAGEAALAKARAEREAAKAESDRRQAALQALEARAAALAAEQDSLAQRLVAAERAQADLQGQLESKAKELEELTRAAAGDSPDDLARLEVALSERAAHVRGLEDQLREADRLAKGLVRELSARKATTNGSPAPGPAPLAVENARLRADLEALGWTVEELERRLSAQAGGEAEPQR